MTDPTTNAASPSANGAHPPTIVDKSNAYRATGEAVELLRSDAGDVSATTVTMDRSGAEHITAERVTLNRAGAKSIEAKSAQLDRSGVLNLKSDHTVLQASSAIAINTRESRLVKSKILFYRSDSTVVEGELKTLVHVGEACGDVKPMLDGAGALKFGAAFAAVLLIGGRLLRRLAGR